MYLSNGVPFSILGLIFNYCAPIRLDGFPNATTLLSLSFECDIKSGDVVLPLTRSCWCDGFHNTGHCLFGPHVTKLIWPACQG